MPSARDTRSRIKGVESTRQITRAMQLVATSKMNRAQEAVRATRPYADKISEVLRHLALAIPSEDGLHPLFVARPEINVALVVLSTNRGLCGALNTNVARRALELTEEVGSSEEETKVSLVGVGKVGVRLLSRALPVVASFTEVPDRPRIIDVLAIARLVVDGFESREFDAVYVVYPDFVNTLTQRPEHVRLLPVTRPEALETVELRPDYIYEPNAETVFEHAVAPVRGDVPVPAGAGDGGERAQRADGGDAQRDGQRLGPDRRTHSGLQPPAAGFNHQRNDRHRRRGERPVAIRGE